MERFTCNHSEVLKESKSISWAPSRDSKNTESWMFSLTTLCTRIQRSLHHLYFLIGAKVQTTHVPSIKRKYTVWGVSSQSADRLQFDVNDETSGRRTKTTVAAYFRDRYRMQLRYASLHLTIFFQQRF